MLRYSSSFVDETRCFDSRAHNLLREPILLLFVEERDLEHIMLLIHVGLPVLLQYLF